MARNIFRCLFFLSIFFLFSFRAKDVYGYKCYGRESRCENYCNTGCSECQGNTAWCDSKDNCHCTCGNCVVGNCGWSDWYDCSNGGCYECRNMLIWYAGKPGYCGASGVYQIRKGSCPPPACKPGNTSCGSCSVSCGGGTQSCTDGCDTWNQACNTQACAPPSCSLNLSPAITRVSVGNQISFVASVTNIQNGSVAKVDFASSNSSIASVSPASDDKVVYQTKAKGEGVGSTSIRAGVIMSGAERCFQTSTITVTPPGPWWQVKDSDVTTNGNLKSKVPDGLVFGLDGAGGYPGVSFYGGSSDLTRAKVSRTGWQANSSTFLRKTFDSKWFQRWVPKEVVFNEISLPIVAGSFFASGGETSFGYYWYKFTGATTNFDLTINGDMDLGNRKVILFVDSADLYLNGKINLTDGQGFFMVLVGKNASGYKGNILVNPAVGGSADGVPELEGFFLADSSFQTGRGSSQLHLRGSVAAYEGVSLERDLAGALNETTPAELFEYAPDLVFLYPRKLSFFRMRWKEVAP